MPDKEKPDEVCGLQETVSALKSAPKSHTLAFSDVIAYLLLSFRWPP